MQTITQRRALQWALQQAGATGKKTAGPVTIRHPSPQRGWMMRIRAATLAAILAETRPGPPREPAPKPERPPVVVHAYDEHADWWK